MSTEGCAEPEGIEWCEWDPDGVELFYDTSVFYSHLLKSEGVSELIEEVADAFRWRATSTYLKLEYGNTVLNYCVWLKRILRKKGFKGALEHVAEVLPAFHRGRRIFGLHLLTKYADRGGEDAAELAGAHLRRLIKTHLDAVSSYFDTPLEDGTGCYWAQKESHLAKDGKTWRQVKCKPEKRRCRIDTFFEENKEAFLRIRAAIGELQNPTAQLQDFAEIIDEAVEDSAILLDHRNCRRFGDALIAMDGSGYRNVFSQNPKEYRVLCQALGQTFVCLPAHAERAVEVYDYAGAMAGDAAADGHAMDRTGRANG
ncbi:MAG: hypothetical protein R6V05_09565 [Candidatus Brocadiia bacterium]